MKWFKDGKEIIPDGKRIQIVSEGKKRKLIIKNCKLEDAGMITAKTTGDERSAPLGVKREYIYGSNKCCRMGAQYYIITRTQSIVLTTKKLQKDNNFLFSLI